MSHYINQKYRNQKLFKNVISWEKVPYKCSRFKKKSRTLYKFVSSLENLLRNFKEGENFEFYFISLIHLFFFYISKIFIKRNKEEKH